MGNADPFLSSQPQPWTIEVWDAASGSTKVVWQSTHDANGSYLNEGDWEDEAFRFAAGDRIVFASQEDGGSHLYSVAATGGMPVLLTPGSFAFNGPTTLTADRKAVLYSSNENDVDRRHLWRVDVDRADPVALTGGASIEWSPVVTGDGRHVVFFGSTATQPAMPYRLTGSGREMIAADSLPATIPPSSWRHRKRLSSAASIGRRSTASCCAASSHGAQPRLIFTHGGPFGQTLRGFHPMDVYNYMMPPTSIGEPWIVVLSVNYRLSTGYGRAFVSRRTGGDGAPRSIRMWSRGPVSAGAHRSSIRAGSDRGAAPTAAIRRHWAWRASRISSRRVSTTPAWTTGRRT